MESNGRLELKFAASPVRRHELLTWLRLHPLGFRTAFPPRWVNNVYFDTHELTAFRENAAGIGSRVKLRYRWYGDASPIGAGSLEVKKKRGRLGWKSTFPVAAPPPAGTWRGLAAGLRASLPARGRTWLEAFPAPVLFNRYLREYLVSADGALRVTLDRRQAAADQRVRQRPGSAPGMNLPDALILELKFPPSAHEAAQLLAAGLPLRAVRHSKYASGADLLLSS